MNRVELKAVDPPPSIQEAMEKQMRAERDRRAAILTAEGVKQSQILTAEGEKQSAILRAEGWRESQILEAEGESKAIETVFDAIHRGDADPKLLAYQYLRTLPQIANGEASKVWIVPERAHPGAGQPGRDRPQARRAGAAWLTRRRRPRSWRPAWSARPRRRARLLPAAGADARQVVLDTLPDGWSPDGKRILDFGAGAGKVLRHLLDDWKGAELQGCDIDRASIEWLGANLSPPVHAFVNRETPPLDCGDGRFDLVLAMSVFTHLTDHSLALARRAAPGARRRRAADRELPRRAGLRRLRAAAAGTRTRSG